MLGLLRSTRWRRLPPLQALLVSLPAPRAGAALPALTRALAHSAAAAAPAPAAEGDAAEPLLAPEPAFDYEALAWQPYHPTSLEVLDAAKVAAEARSDRETARLTYRWERARLQWAIDPGKQGYEPVPNAKSTAVAAELHLGGGAAGQQELPALDAAGSRSSRELGLEASSSSSEGEGEPPGPKRSLTSSWRPLPRVSREHAEKYAAALKLIRSQRKRHEVRVNAAGVLAALRDPTRTEMTLTRPLPLGQMVALCRQVWDEEGLA